MLDEIGGRLNFSYVVVSPVDKSFGKRASNGQFNGVVGMLQRGEAQISAAVLVVDTQRMEVVNFSLPISLEPYTMMIRRPQELSRALLFIDPFTPLVLFRFFSDFFRFFFNYFFLGLALHFYCCRSNRTHPLDCS